MIISGPGISTFTAKIKQDFLPVTTLALNWYQLGNGEWACTDRKAASDQYDATIRIYRDETTINNFISQIAANRGAGVNTFTLSDISTGEHIFGADVDYSSYLSVSAFMEFRAQKTWRGWELPLTLKCLSPTFVGGSGSLPQLRFLDIGYLGESEYTINKYDSYTRKVIIGGTPFYGFSDQDHDSDAGIFTGVFTFDNAEMIQIRRFVATQRGTKFVMPTIIGVDKPFGRRSPPYPIYTKMKEFEDMGMYSIVDGLPRWRAKTTLVEEMEMVSA